MPDSAASATTRRARAIEERLARTYPDAHCALRHRNAFELLVATVLSAQTTDARVNTVTPELFATYPDPEALAAADPDDVSAIVRPLGFQRRRGTQLVALADGIVHRFGGEVPQNRRDLVSLPGVGRKTAHVVLGNCFGVPSLTVDTHVGRLAARLGISDKTTPRAIEDDLAAHFTRDGEQTNWTVLCHRLITLGREICHARGPECDVCPLAQLCPSAPGEANAASATSLS
ncbi:endonuclease III [Nanchangia anserum]|uniref:Endonuclease III n=1 Tax=Nanchangia anserum TaxID=2692125 RepID=A0A8I0GGG9_9ACTO|nr:endonuclease III [Nanchangia anserum]